MLHNLLAFVVTYLALSALALPNNVNVRPDKRWFNETYDPATCGPVAKFFNPTAEDWEKYDTGSFLNRRFDEFHKSGSDNFAVWFGQWALGLPELSCRDDGSDSNCYTMLCNNPVLNSKGDEIRQTYYVLLATRHLHDCFGGFSEALQMGSIAAALAKDEWVRKFYHHHPDDDVVAKKELLNGFAAMFSIAAASGSFLAPQAAFAVGAMNALFGGIQSGVRETMAGE